MDKQEKSHLKALPGAKDLRELEKVCGSLAKSSRFALLRNVPIAQFIKKPAGLSASALTSPMSALVEDGPVAFIKLHGITPAGVRSMANALKKISAGAENEPAAISPQPPRESPLKEESPRTHDLHILGGAEAESRLIEALGRLRAAPAFSLIAARTLKEFWQKDWARAPFEETMTFRQLSEINVEALLKKRSFDGRKVQAVLGAIQNALAAHAEAPVAGEGTVRPAAQLRALPWLGSSGESLPTWCDALIYYYEAQTAAHLERSTIFSRVAEQIAGVVSREELACAWLANHHSPSALCALLGKSAADLASLTEGAHRKVEMVIRKELPALVTGWEAALATPGISAAALYGPHLVSGLDQGFQVMICLTALRALGADHPQIRELRFAELLTRNLRSAEIIFDGVLAGLPKSEEQLREALKVALPFFNEQQLFTLIARVARFDSASRRWTKKR